MENNLKKERQNAFDTSSEDCVNVGNLFKTINPAFNLKLCGVEQLAKEQYDQVQQNKFIDDRCFYLSKSPDFILNLNGKAAYFDYKKQSTYIKEKYKSSVSVEAGEIVTHAFFNDFYKMDSFIIFETNEGLKVAKSNGFNKEPLQLNYPFPSNYLSYLINKLDFWKINYTKNPMRINAGASGNPFFVLSEKNTKIWHSIKDFYDDYFDNKSSIVRI